MALGNVSDETDQQAPQIGRDRNLLFGVLALQLRFVRPEQFLDAASAWATDPSRPVADRLVDSGALEEKQRKLVAGLVDEAIEQHEGDAHRTLETFGGESAVAEQLSGISRTEHARDAATKLGIPLDVEDVDSDDVSAVWETPGRYTRTSEYTRGGMGRILLVHDEYLSRDIALKELIPPSDMSYTALGGKSPVRALSSMVVRFLREAKVTGQLEHPSIVPVYELGRRPNGTLYYTMKLVRGQTLAQALRNVSTLKERLTYLSHFVDMCQAIGYAHSRSVIHRDIKPSNVMLGEFGETVVIDWGLAKVVGQPDIHEEELRETWSKLRGQAAPDPAKTAPGTRLGTPHYMAPEQAKGHIDEIDQRTDVFALGAVLYEVLTGRVPFDGKTTEAVFEQVVEAAPRPVRELSPEAPPELASVCAKAMAKDPAKRYANGKELADEIERFLTGAVVQAYDYSAGEVLARYYGRHRALINTAAAALIAILALGVFSYFNIRDARDEAVLAREDADDKTYVSQIRLAQEYLDQYAHTLARQTLWETDPVRRNWEWGYLLNRAYDEIYSIPEVVRFAINPSGTRIAASSRTQPIRIFDAATGALLTTFSESTARLVDDLEYSPTGDRVAAGGVDGAARVWDAETGELLLTVGDYPGPARTAAFDPTGERLLVSGSGSGTVTIYDAASGEALQSFEVTTPAQHQWSAWSSDGNYVVVRSDDGTSELSITVWRSETSEVIWTGSATGNPSIGAADELLAIVDGTGVDVYSLSDVSAPTARLVESDGNIYSVAFSQSGDRIVTTGPGLARVWNPRTGDELYSIRHDTSEAHARFDDGEILLLTWGRHLPMRVWDAVTGGALRTYFGHEARNASDRIIEADYLQAGERIASVGGDYTLRIWDARYTPLERRLPVNAARVWALAQSGDGARLAVASDFGDLAILDAEDEQVALTVHSFSVNTSQRMAFDPSGRGVAVALDLFTAMVLDASNGAVLSTFAAHEGPIQYIAFSPDGESVATGSIDETVRVWDAGTGEERWRGSVPDTWIEAVAFSPSGDRLVAGGTGGELRVWDAATGAELATLRGHEDDITGVAWRSDGAELATASVDGTLMIWDAGTWALQRTLEVQGGPTGSVAYSTAGDRLLSTGSGTVQVWDSSRGTELVTVDHGVGTPVPATDGRGLYTTAGVRVEAAPWRIEELPGDAAMDWPERFAQYRVNTIEAQRARDSRPSSGPIPYVVLTTREVLSERLERLRAALAAEVGEAGDTNGLLLTSGERRDAGARIGFREGDRITAIGGASIADRAGALAALDRALATLPDVEFLTFALTRGESTYDGRWTLVPRVEREVLLRPSRQEALAAFTTLASPAMGSTIWAVERNQKLVNRMGEPHSSSDGMAGYSVSPVRHSPAFVETHRAHKRLGRSIGDRILTIDGEAVNNFSQISSLTRTAIDALSSGAPFEVTMDVERGEFQRVELTIRVE